MPETGQGTSRPLSTVVVLCGLLTAAGLGFLAGQQTGRKQQDAACEERTLAQLDARAKQFDKLTFYRTLTAPEASSPLTASPAAAGYSPQRPAAAGQGAPPRPPAPPPAPTPPTPGPSNAPRPMPKPALKNAASSTYTVQISSFTRQADAQKLAAQLQKRGIAVQISRANLPGRGTWHRVQIGRFDSRPAAQAEQRRLAARQIVGQVVKAP